MKLIPDTLRIYTAPEETITVDGDSTIKVIVNPVFVTASDNPMTNKTAQHWVEGYCRTYDREKQRYVSYKKPNIFEVPNTPFLQPQILELEQRGNGGRAYKVAIPMSNVSSGLIYVDFRENELLDAIQNVGILAGGKLNAEYIFGSVGGQMKLFRVSSKVHTDTIEKDNRKASTVIPMTKLVVGHWYETASGTKQIYLGKFSVTYKAITQKPNPSLWGNNENIITLEAPIKEHLFIGVASSGQQDFQYYSFTTKKSSSFVIDHGVHKSYSKIDIKTAIHPEDARGYHGRYYIGSKILVNIEPLK